MTSRIVLALALLVGSGIAPVFAAPYQQDVSISSGVNLRNPIYGDPGLRSANPHWTARQWARADRQGLGTENGNQPDRAEAGGGAR
jgi:hypothetical protein